MQSQVLYIDGLIPSVILHWGTEGSPTLSCELSYTEALNLTPPAPTTSAHSFFRGSFVLYRCEL